MKKIVFFVPLLFMNMGHTMTGNQKSPVETVQFVNLQKYVGKWYEIASIPAWFQKDCISNTTAEYSFAENNLIKVLNSCETQNGERKFAEARAKVMDITTNSKLKVTFVKFFYWIFAFGGNYWILNLASDYSYSIVGDPTRKYAWILSREPLMPQDKLIAAENSLKSQGYDTCKVLTSVQQRGFSARTPLCEAVFPKALHH
ncbi:MAG: lipocalin family protein [Pseudobdellovibrionaceae bacterium]